jgi:8-oxo-dGTP pyrophosphatase MutT (NUDIX family)
MTRFTLPAAVFLLLLKEDKVLLIRRKNTGWCDGDYDLVAGHIDGGEHLTTALIREAQEEVGISMSADDARFVHLTHCVGGKEYLYIAFEVKKWRGEPTIREPENHDDLRWFPLSALPPNITPGARTVLSGYTSGNTYSELHF